MIQNKRDLLISKVWIQAIVIVGLFGFLILGILAYRTYTDEAPIPPRVIGSNGQVLFTGQDMTAGQEIFLKNGLMEYGSIYGHGAYLGPDYTADYLHRAALISVDHYGGSSSGSAREQTIADFKANRYDAASGILTFSAAQTEAFDELVFTMANSSRRRTRVTACVHRRLRTPNKSGN
jgi:nitric oxide reductase subunit B